jgi:hypothetical protein
MFRGPPEEQARKLGHILTVVVKGLSRPEQIHSRKAPAPSVSAKGDVNQFIAHLKAMPQAHPVPEKKVK